MTVETKRHAAVADSIEAIRTVLAAGATPGSLEAAGAILARLAARPELFDRTSFPVPAAAEFDRTYLLRQDDDGGFALYVNAGTAGQTFHPHDHGGAWAMVAAIEGSEIHRFWRRSDGTHGLGPARLETIGESVLEPGGVVTMKGDGIHSIHACGDAPILHLHMYAFGFAHQGDRIDYDLASNRAYRLEDMSRFLASDFVFTDCHDNAGASGG